MGCSIYQHSGLHDKTSHQNDLLDTIPLLIFNRPLIQPRSLVPVSQRRLFDPGAERGREKVSIKEVSFNLVVTAVTLPKKTLGHFSHDPMAAICLLILKY